MTPFDPNGNDEIAKLIEQLMFEEKPQPWRRALGSPSGLYPPTGELGDYLNRIFKSSTHKKSSYGR